MPTSTLLSQKVIIKRSGLDNLGTYWMAGPKVSPMQLLAACRNGGRLKQADIGGEQEGGFEQAFSSLAFSYVRDKVPKLMPYLVGFQLVDRNDDNTKAAGVFGFKIGKEWFYVPVFFLNGDLKGHELLYVKNRDVFVPLKENWVDYILAQRPRMLGEGTPKDSFGLGGLSPNLERLSYPPTRSKFGSDMQEWVHGYLPMAGAIATKSARLLDQNRKAAEALDLAKLYKIGAQVAMRGMPSLETLLQCDWHVVKIAHEWSQRYPAIKIGFDRFHGPDFLKNLAQWHKKALDLEAQNIVPTGPMVKKAVGDAKVKILLDEDASVVDNLSDKEKEQMLHHGYLVKDERTGEEVTKVYNTQVRQTLTNPDESGIYDMLESPGEFQRMLIISAPMHNAGKADFSTAIRIGDGAKEWINAHKLRLWARPRIEGPDDFQNWFEKLDKSTDLSNGATYIAVGPQGQGTVPFEVSRSYSREGYKGYKVDFRDSADYSRGRRPSWAPRTEGSDNCGPCCCAISGEGEASTYDATLVISSKPNTGMVTLGGELHIPAEFKFLKLKEPPKPKPASNDIVGEACCGDCGSDPKPIVPGDIKDIQMMFHEKMSSMRLMADGPHVHITAHKKTRKLASYDGGWDKALHHLILIHGLTEKSAKEVLETARAAGVLRSAVDYRVKYADNYPSLQPGPSAPGIAPPNIGTEQIGYNSVNSIYPQDQNVPVPELDSGRTDPRIYDPFLNITPDQKAVSFAQQAEQGGQKEIFDTAAFATMLKAVKPDSLADQYLGSLVKATSNLGKLLMLYYWHGEELADIDKADMRETEDGMRNAFEALGDVVLHLKSSLSSPDLDEYRNIDLKDVADN